MHFLLTEPDRRALTRFNEAMVRRRSPAAPRWLRRAIAERLTLNVAEALASSDATRSARAQAIVRQVVGAVAPATASRNPSSDNNLAQ